MQIQTYSYAEEYTSVFWVEKWNKFDPEKIWSSKINGTTQSVVCINSDLYKLLNIKNKKVHLAFSILKEVQANIFLWLKEYFY